MMMSHVLRQEVLPEAASQNHFKESLATERLFAVQHCHAASISLIISRYCPTVLPTPRQRCRGFVLQCSPLPFLLLARASCLAETFSVCHQSGLVLFTALFGHGHMAFFCLSITLCMSAMNDKMPMCTSLHFDDKTPE